MANSFHGRFGRANITRPRGCLFQPGLVAIGLMAGGIFAMSNWDTLSGFGRAGAVVLVVVGTLMLLPVVVLLCVSFYLNRMVNHLMKSGDIIDVNQTIIVEENAANDNNVIDAIGPGESDRRKKPTE